MHVKPSLYRRTLLIKLALLKTMLGTETQEVVLDPTWAGKDE